MNLVNYTGWRIQGLSLIESAQKEKKTIMHFDKRTLLKMKRTAADHNSNVIWQISICQITLNVNNAG